MTNRTNHDTGFVTPRAETPSTVSTLDAGGDACWVIFPLVLNLLLGSETAFMSKIPTWSKSEKKKTRTWMTLVPDYDCACIKNMTRKCLVPFQNSNVENVFLSISVCHVSGFI